MDYNEEMGKLKKKLTILLILAIGFTLLFKLAMDASIFTALGMGLLIGLVFYIPGRLKGLLNAGWGATIIITLIYYAVIIGLSGALGSWVYGIAIIIPALDIAYSIYKIISAKKEV